MECKHRGDCCWDFEDTCVEPSMDSEDKFIIACWLSLTHVQMLTIHLVYWFARAAITQKLGGLKQQIHFLSSRR